MLSFKNLEVLHKPEIDERFHQLNAPAVWNTIYWWRFFEMAAHISGDIVECGVGRGRSLLIIAGELLEAHEGGRREIFACDSFAGFPEPTLQDASHRNPKRGEWAKSPSGRYEYSPDFVRSVLTESSINPDRITFRVGYFCETLPHHPNRPIALLHVDGDLYQSHIDTLSSLYDKVVTGGVIIFDDLLFEYDPNDCFPGARIAVKEFLGDMMAKLQRSISGCCYLVKE
jgi:O-methyltransferase